MKIQALEVEVAQLREKVAALTRGQPIIMLPASSAPVVMAAITMTELLQREERPHPASGPKKKPQGPRRSKKGYLRGVAAGSLLTQPEMVQGLLEQEAKDREKAEQKEAATKEAQELNKRKRAEAATEKKKAAGTAGTPPAPRKRRAAEAVKDLTEEKAEAKEGAATKRGWMFWAR